MNLRQAKKRWPKKVWDAAGMAGGDFAPKWVGQGIPSANIWLGALRACFTGAWRTGRLGRPKRLFDDFRVG